MRPVFQTRFGGPNAPPGEVGNCYAACLASILELPLEAIPDGIGTTDRWFDKANDFLRTQGLQLLCFEHDGARDTPWPKDVWCIISGKSPRGDWMHSTVGRNGKTVHDPNPAGGDLRGTARQIEFLVPIDPSAPRIALFVTKETKLDERAQAVRFLRHWASLSSAFEDVAGRDLLYQFAKRLEDGEHMLPPGVTTVRDPSKDMPPHGEEPSRP